MIRFDRPPSRNHRYRHRPGAYVILIREGRVLLTEQAGQDLELQLPGGGVDPGEQTVPALHREVLEETGWRMGRAVRLGAYRRFTFMPEYGFYAEKICHIYLGRPTLCLGAPREPDHRAVWMGMADALTALTNTGDRHFLRLSARRFQVT